MTALLTNDDGVQAEGLLELRRALIAADIPVITVAPAENNSGVARLSTFSDPVFVELLEEDGLGPVYSCHGTPVDCVRVGLLSDIASEAELVISGINYGCNLGDDILVSGTVGAASEGALLGVPALAVSEQTKRGSFHVVEAHEHSERSAERVAPLTADLARAMLASSPPMRTVLNVNFPSGTPLDVDSTYPSRRLYERGAVKPDARSERPNGYRTYGTREDGSPGFEMSQGTDAHAIAAGHISVSPISYEWNPKRPDGPAIWVTSLITGWRQSVQGATRRSP